MSFTGIVEHLGLARVIQIHIAFAGNKGIERPIPHLQGGVISGKSVLTLDDIAIVRGKA